ncbi:polysaccharide deacetylase family protein [Plantactinospora sp. CA-290183]|uniref:polysaccharide deacetylase family protein n=1 Tax=Plantactinospora sp. CA-290183 TaxID=3240006 RepID=UPI003D8B2C18
MYDDRDVVARDVRVRRLGDDFRWPGGRHVAVVFNVAFEAWSDGRAPGVGPMGNVLAPGTFDTNALMWGHYGAARGMRRLLRVLDRVGTRASVMVSGVLAERDPELVSAIAGAGHEIVAHGYAQEIVPAGLSADADRDNISRTTELLRAATGESPRGWISPRGTPGAETARALLAAGYAWHGDVFDDDRPYLQLFGEGRIVGIPLTMEINDLPHAMRFGRSPRQFVENFDDLLTAALADPEEAVLIDVTAHAHCYGRPAGAWAYEAIAQRVRDRRDVWVATRAEIARHVEETCPEKTEREGGR